MKTLLGILSSALVWALPALAGVGSQVSIEPASARAATPPRGELLTGLSAGDEDSPERYALYLPSAYDPERPWPALIVMDPRGRAAMAAEIFLPAAERFGYLVLSSESTRSDSAPGASDPNEPALRALLATALADYSVDPARTYLAGFSGTSRFAWMAGKAFPERIAGIIGVGGGLPGHWQEWNQVSFSYFGAAGNHDFNHREMRQLDELLDGALPHRFHFFAGRHQWLGTKEAELALGWMELEAMRRGLAESQPQLIEALWAERLEAADDAERQARLFDAFEALLAIAEDFDRLAPAKDLDPVRDRLTGLATHEKVSRANREIAEAIESERSYREKLGAVVRRIAYDPSPPGADSLIKELRIASLEKRSRGSGRTADSATRQLELAFVHVAFYTPSGLMAKKAPRRAALSLEVATRIFPDRVYPWLRLAEARVGAGHKRAAISALAEAVGRGFSDTTYLETNETLDPLRGEPAFKDLVRRLE